MRTGQSLAMPTAASVALAARQSSTSGGDAMQKPSTEGWRSQIVTNSEASGNGRGRNSTPLTTEKTAVVAPRASPSVSMAATV